MGVYVVVHGWLFGGLGKADTEVYEDGAGGIFYPVVDGVEVAFHGAGRDEGGQLSRQKHWRLHLGVFV